MDHSPEPLMLLPAMGCDGQLWARQIMDLGDRAAPEFSDLAQDDTLSDMATRVLSECPPRFAVAGVSLGGYVAMEMVRQAPERVTRVALFGTRATMDIRPRTVVGQGLLATAPHADPRLTAIVHVPTLVAVGDRDRICTPDDARALADRIPGAVFHVLRSCGHLSPMERPGEVTMLLRQWLRRPVHTESG
jgi:pimeloyl-ACP methyl ester carboxylesterase